MSIARELARELQSAGYLICCVADLRVPFEDAVPILVKYLGQRTLQPPVHPREVTETLEPMVRSLGPLLSRCPTLRDFPEARRLVYDQPPQDLLEVLRSGLRVRQASWVVPFSRVFADEDFGGGPDAAANA